MCRDRQQHSLESDIEDQRKTKLFEDELTSHQNIPPEATSVPQHLSTTTQHPCFRRYFVFYCSFHQVHLVPLTSGRETGVLMTPSTWQAMSERQLYQMVVDKDNWLESEFN
jgi:hypothetical protein